MVREIERDGRGQYIYMWDTLDKDEAMENMIKWLALCNRNGQLLEAHMLPQIAKFILAERLFDNQFPSIKAIREWGRLITKEERKSMGIKSRVELGDLFVASLTENARVKANENAQIIAYWPWHISQQYFMQRLIVNNGSLVRYRVYPQSCCQLAMPFVGKVGSAEDIQFFPIDGCDKVQCTCQFERDWEAVEFDRKTLLEAKLSRQNNQANADVFMAVLIWLGRNGFGILLLIFVLNLAFCSK